MVRTRICLWMAIAWLMAAALGFAAILEEGNVTLSPSGVNEVGTFGRGTGDGSVWITPPSTLTGSSLRIASGSSTATLAGNVYVQGGAINLTQDILVSEGGRGLLEVTDGGLVDASTLTLAGPPLAQATMTLSGAGTKARLKQKVTIGAAGLAEVFITDGAQFHTGTQTANQQAIIANHMSSVGSILLDGQSTAWMHNGPIVVGNMGSGSLRAIGGANVTSHGAILGSASGGSPQSLGSAVLDGEGTRWITSSLTIGDRGVGEMRVSDGALLEVTNSSLSGIVLGNLAGSFGRLVISGPGSRWVDSRPVTIGNAGAGELWIEGGAIVSNGGATIGKSSWTRSALAVVRGNQTRWHAGSIAVGIEGTGQLRIEDGATVAIGGEVFTTGPTRIGSRGRITLENGNLIWERVEPFENMGIIEGNGVLTMHNLGNSSGRIKVGDDNLLRIANHLTSSNSGQVEILGGELEIGGVFNNSSQSRVISEGGTLRMRGAGAFNNASVATFLGNGNRVIGRTNNEGTILAAANSGLTFFDDVWNLGSIKASEGAAITLLDSLIGNGIAGPGAVYLEGDVLPTPGVMSFGGDLALGGQSLLALDVFGANPGVEHDKLSVDGALTLSGELHVVAQERLNEEVTLTIATAGELSGVFSWTSEIGADVGFGVRFNGVNYDYESDAVTVSLLPSPPLPGDFDLDGSVDGADFLTWQRQLGDAMDADDLALWQQGFVENTPALQAAHAAVPEPAAAALILVGLLGFGARRVVGRRALPL